MGAENRIRRFLLLRYMAGIAHPGGGLFATLDDLLLFGAACLSPRLDQGQWMPISAKTFALMGEDHVRGLPGRYNDEDRPVPRPRLGQADADEGRARLCPRRRPRRRDRRQLWIDPDLGLVFVFFTNGGDGTDRGPEVAALRALYDAVA